jgi:hypothetical protein
MDTNQDLAIAITGAKNAELMYAAMNKKNIALYNENAAAGHPSSPPPIYTFNSEMYIALSMEQSANPGATLDWSQCVTVTTYVPPATPPTGVHLPTVVVQPYNAAEFPGWYDLAPDSTELVDGTQTTIDAVVWTKGTVPGATSIAGPVHKWRAQ